MQDEETTVWEFKLSVVLTETEADTLANRLADLAASYADWAIVASKVSIPDSLDNGQGYDPERDDFENETDTGPDYEGDRYSGGVVK